MIYTHTIDIGTPNGTLEGEYVFNGGGKPKMKILAENPEIDIKEDKRFHRVMDALEEFYKYNKGLTKFEVRLKE